MILVIGGYASGKRTYVKETYGFTDNDLADGVLDNRPAVYNAQDLAAGDHTGTEALLSELLKKEVVICNEVGSGVIPLSKQDRDAREAAGRLCVLLAKEATRVIRIVCGLPAVLKEQAVLKE